MTSRPARTSTRRARRLLLTLVALALGLGLPIAGPHPAGATNATTAADGANAAGTTGAAPAQTTGCPSVNGNFADAGPFEVTVQQEAEHTYYRPTQLGSRGCTKHPVILWGNGTWTTPDVYDQLLRHLASHGFIVAAANTSNAGSGVEIKAGLDHLTTFNGQSGSPYYQRVDLTRVGATGHSQGGGGAIEAGKDPRVKVLAPLAPFMGSQTGLQSDDIAIFFAGSADTWVPPATVKARYDGVTIPAAYAELKDANHFIPAATGGDFRAPLTAWFRWHLMGDATARSVFLGANCGLCTDAKWTGYVTNAALQRLGTPGPDPTTTTTTRPGPTTSSTQPGPGGQCVTATNQAHAQAGRVTVFLIFAFAKGTSRFVGFTWTTTSLRQNGSGGWDQVQNC